MIIVNYFFPLYRKKYHERKKAYFDSLKKKKEHNSVNSDDVLVKTKGAILKISGLQKDTKFGEIKDELSKHSKVAFVTNVNDELKVNETILYLIFHKKHF